MTALLRPEIHGLSQYRLEQHPFRIKLNQNENPYELPPEIKEEILRRLGSARWSRYPAFVPKKQIDAVASFTGWRNDGVLLGNGSNDLLQLAFTSTLERGKSLVISQPTFSLYKLLGQSLAARVVEVPMKTGFAFDIDGIVNAAVRNDASLIVLCSPNNPTGTCLAESELRTIIERTQGLVVLDEAYVHFSKGSLAHMLRTYDRLVVLQTFSKAMAAAGIRFGYALCNPSLARQLSKVKLPYSVNIFTLTAVEVLITRWDSVKGWIQQIIDERQRVFERLQMFPHLRAHSSGANFLLFESLITSPKDVFHALLRRGILIRDVSSYPHLDRGLRMSVGTPTENNEFLSVLAEAV